MPVINRNNVPTTEVPKGAAGKLAATAKAEQGATTSISADAKAANVKIPSETAMKVLSTNDKELKNLYVKQATLVAAEKLQQSSAETIKSEKKNVESQIADRKAFLDAEEKRKVEAKQAEAKQAEEKSKVVDQAAKLEEAILKQATTLTEKAMHKVVSATAETIDAQADSLVNDIALDPTLLGANNSTVTE